MTGNTIHRRLTVLEGQEPGQRIARYSVRVPTGADDATIRAAIAEHRARTKWHGPVVLAGPRMTQVEWLREYGRPD
jgi:hypothetical protein